MRINFLYKGVLVAATLCVAPAALPASPRASRPGAGTVESSKGAFPIDASNLLQQVQMDALSVRNDADQLKARLRDGFRNDWESDSELLESVRARVNEMDKLLSQLRANRSKALPWQQQAIDRITPTVVNLTDTTEAAIASLNDNRGHIYSSDLDGLTGDIYNRASQIDRAVANFEEYANARHEVQQLRQTLGLKNNS
jgi:predicted negative regulator of RcsB-dependent stress response